MGSILATRYSAMSLRHRLDAVSQKCFVSDVPFSIRVRKAFAAQRMKDSGGSEEQIRQVQNDNSPREGMPPAVSVLGLMPIGVGGISGPSGRGIATRAARRNSYRA